MFQTPGGVMKKFLLGSAALVSFHHKLCAGGRPTGPQGGSPACASSNWAGWYGGVNVAAATKRTTLSDDGSDQAIFNGVPVGTHVDQASGFAGGVQVGYNVQKCLTVWGIEADWDWTSLKKSYGVTQAFAPAAGFDYTNSNQMKWFGTIRGRVGIAVENLLLFVTSGLAFAKVNHSITANTVAFPRRGHSSGSGRHRHSVGLGDRRGRGMGAHQQSQPEVRCPLCEVPREDAHRQLCSALGTWPV